MAELSYRPKSLKPTLSQIKMYLKKYRALQNSLLPRANLILFCHVLGSRIGENLLQLYVLFLWHELESLILISCIILLLSVLQSFLCLSSQNIQGGKQNYYSQLIFAILYGQVTQSIHFGKASI